MRAVFALSNLVQADIANARYQNNPELVEAMVRFRNLPEEKIMEKINQGVSKFIELVPYADAMRINLILSALARHEVYTGNPLIGQIVEMLNQETLNE
jgi:hypothetical protein